MNLRRVIAPGITAEYGRVRPGEGPSHTRGGAIGVAFTPQGRAAWSVGGQLLHGMIAPAAVFITPDEGLEWHAWDRVSDSIEIWLDQDRLSRLSHDHGGPARLRLDLHDRIDDPLIVNIAALIRRALCADRPSTETIADLGLRLSEHYLRHFAGLRIPHVARPLDRRRLDRVIAYVEAHLDAELTIARLADVAALSPFQFARAFKAATLSPPHAFVVARRMDRAAALLGQGDVSVASAAEAAGFTSLPHFRRHFLAHWGVGPGAYAAA